MKTGLTNSERNDNDEDNRKMEVNGNSSEHTGI